MITNTAAMSLSTNSVVQKKTEETASSAKNIIERKMTMRVEEHYLREFKYAFCRAYCGKKPIETCDADCKNKTLTSENAGTFKLKDMIEVKK